MIKVNFMLMNIQQTVGCPYLSSLHPDDHLPYKQMKTLLMELPLDRYSVLE